MHEPAPGFEADLLRKIVKGRSPHYMASVLQEFREEKGIPVEVTFPRGTPVPEHPVKVLAKSLARKGLITYEEPRGFGWPQVSATEDGERWVRNN